MEKGFIKLHRSILEWGWWGDINTSRLFIYMLIKANPANKNWRGIDVERGSFITSRAILSADTGLTDQQIRTALNHLQNTNEITIKSTNKTTKITVTNYDKYQQSAFVNQPAEQPTSNQQNVEQVTNKTHDEQPANNQYEEVKEEKKEEKKKEDTKVSSKKEKSLFLQKLLSFGIEEQVAEDWIAIRNAKKASKSNTALKIIENALHSIKVKYGISANDAISICVSKGWYGCNVSYFENVCFSDYGITSAQQEMNLQIKKDYWQ